MSQYISFSHKKKPTKKECELKHARRRAQERLGIELTQAHRDYIIHAIRSGIAEFIERKSLRVTKFRMKLAEIIEPIVVVYDKERKQIVTVWKDAPKISHKE